MLMSLLPGLRDLRTPLATGYAWLIVGWLLASELLPSKDAATRGAAALYRLGDLVGGPAVLAGVSFAAYLVGSLTHIKPTTAGSNRRTIFGMAFNYPRVEVGMSEQNITQLNYFVRPIARQAERTPTDLYNHVMAMEDVLTDTTLTRYKDYLRRTSDDPEHAPKIEKSARRWALRDSILEELPQLSIRLQAENKDLHEAYDRLEAEAEMRLSVAPALLALILALAYSWSLW